jgi:hypothetical protein
VSYTVSASRAHNKTSIVPKTQKLPPRPEGEVVTIAPPDILELFGRHPVVLHPELFSIGNVPAGLQKGADLVHVTADDIQGLTDERAHWAALKPRVPPFARTRYAFAVEIVKSWNDFGDHDVFRLLLLRPAQYFQIYARQQKKSS